MTDEQAEARGTFAEVPTRPELERFFFLDDDDRDLIALRRTDAHCLGMAVQICTVRHVGRFLGEDPLRVPWEAVEYLAGQLGIEDSRHRLARRSATASGSDPPGVPRGPGGPARRPRPGPQRGGAVEHPLRGRRRRPAPCGGPRHQGRGRRPALSAQGPAHQLLGPLAVQHQGQRAPARACARYATPTRPSWTRARRARSEHEGAARRLGGSLDLGPQLGSEGAGPLSLDCLRGRCRRWRG